MESVFRIHDSHGWVGSGKRVRARAAWSVGAMVDSFFWSRFSIFAWRYHNGA